MIIRKNKSLLVVLTALALCAVTASWVARRDHAESMIQTSPPIAIGPDKADPMASVAPDSQSNLPVASVANPAATQVATAATPLTAQQLSDQLEPQREAWRRAHGLLSAEVRERYRALSDDDLRKLAANGDIAAMTELARRLRNTDESDELNRQAEVRGSIEPAVDSIRATQRLLETPNPDQWQSACMGMWSAIFYLDLVGFYEVMQNHVDMTVRARCESTVMTASQMYAAFWTAKRRLLANNQRRALLALPPLESQGMPGNFEWMEAENARMLEATRAGNERFRARFPNEPVPSAIPRPAKPDANGG